MGKTENNKGIQIIKPQGDRGISIEIGGKKIKPSGEPIEINLTKKRGKVYVLLDCSGSMAGKQNRPS